MLTTVLSSSLPVISSTGFILGTGTGGGAREVVEGREESKNALPKELREMGRTEGAGSVRLVGVEVLVTTVWSAVCLGAGALDFC